MKSPCFAEAENNGAQWATNVRSNGHEMIVDELEDVGGKNLGPSPIDYLCMSLASCKAMTLRMYVQRKKWEVDTIKVKVNFVQNETTPGGPNSFLCEITVSGKIDEAQLNRLGEISKVCPISKVLIKQNELVTNVSMI